jgi:nucleoside-diphosphate-sugar epimerase
LAGVFAPGVETPAATFLSNVESTFNVFRAAALTGVRRVAWASTCAVTGAPFGDPHEPSRVPLVEDDRTNCSTTYALSKLAGEIISAESRLWDDVSFAALRFGRIYHPGQYGALESLWDDPHASKFNLWTYVDVRDVAQACVKAMSASFSGSEVFFITAADTVMQRDSRDLVRDVFPNAEIDDGLKGRGTLFSIEKARRLLGYEPAYSWRDELEGERAA